MRSVASTGVLLRGLDEARLRDAPLRVLTSWQSRFTDIHDSHAVADGNRLAKAATRPPPGCVERRYPISTSGRWSSTAPP